MEDRGLNHDLKSKVLRYFGDLEKKNIKDYEIRNEMIRSLPSSLKSKAK